MATNQRRKQDPAASLGGGASERLLTVEELAEWLGVPVGTIYAWRYRGCGPASYKIGRHVRFRRGDVEVWLEEQRSEPLEQSPLRRLLRALPDRNSTRNMALGRSRGRPIQQMRNPLILKAIAGASVPSPLPDPTPASCVTGVGEQRRRQGRERR